MALFLLRKNAMAPGFGLVVRASTEFHARNFAKKFLRSLHSMPQYVADSYLDPKETTCTLLNEQGVEGVVSMDGDSGWVWGRRRRGDD